MPTSIGAVIGVLVSNNISNGGKIQRGITEIISRGRIKLSDCMASSV